MTESTPSIPAEQPNRLGDFLLWLLIGLAIFTLPRPPALELDASWRMTLGYAFTKNLQWGTDIVFTYGPLGFLMGKTYWGQLFWEMVGWQVFQAMVFSFLLLSEGKRLRGVSRFFYFAFVLLLGVIYEDALHMIAIALLGWRLLRRADEETPRAQLWAAALLAVLGAVKFTNLLFAATAVALAAALALYRRAPRAAALNAGAFAGTYLAVWLLCGQNPLNLPAYVIGSLQVSSGYTDGMSIPTPADALGSGLLVAALLATCLVLHVRDSRRRAFALANATLCAAFLFLNWKHGFVRADGHMIGFFICALLAIVAFPSLFADAPAGRWARQLILLAAALLCLVGFNQALPGSLRGTGNQLMDHVWGRVATVAHWEEFRQGLRAQMHAQRKDSQLDQVHAAVGTATVDVIGHLQAVALFNKLNYHPRPVFQSYSAYSAPLSRRNLDFYGSKDAPEYVLLAIETLDGRLPTMDDSLLLNYLPHAYDYVLTEKSWQLWRRRPDAPSPAAVAPRRLSTSKLALGEALEVSERGAQPTWISVDLTPSLFGRIRKFLYKQPLVQLVVEDTAGQTTRYRMPPEEGRAGFIINPLIEDVADFVNAAGLTPKRRVARVRVEVEGGDRFFFRPRAEVGLFALTASEAGVRAQAVKERAVFAVFTVMPSAVHTYAPPSPAVIDGISCLVLHAPSDLEFTVPAGATTMVGRFGYPPSAYTGDAKTNGADFRVVWNDGTTEHVLFHQYLDPRKTPADRGLHSFAAPLAGVTGGRVHLVIDAGPGGDNGWDWTAWTGIEIR
jgi:hypothetical protein